ncbi:hypothetical protein LY78DRAFT_220702 [Colletotrichum sublineola]|nr:hypothetical protein LY78DRAFT_220702 [Colletotrichum sublineola]
MGSGEWNQPLSPPVRDFSAELAFSLHAGRQWVHVMRCTSSIDRQAAHCSDTAEPHTQAGLQASKETMARRHRRANKLGRVTVWGGSPVHPQRPKMITFPGRKGSEGGDGDGDGAPEQGTRVQEPGQGLAARMSYTTEYIPALDIHLRRRTRIPLRPISRHPIMVESELNAATVRGRISARRRRTWPA